MRVKSAIIASIALIALVAGFAIPTYSAKTASKAPKTLVIKDKKVGKGKGVVTGDTVTVNYKGWLDDGTVFDTSKKPGRTPFEFTVGAGQVIKGWDKGLVGMKVGGVRELTIPASMGYGPQANGPIPANSTLHFTIELLKIKKG